MKFIFHRGYNFVLRKNLNDALLKRHKLSTMREIHKSNVQQRRNYLDGGWGGRLSKILEFQATILKTNKRNILKFSILPEQRNFLSRFV